MLGKRKVFVCLSVSVIVCVCVCVRFVFDLTYRDLTISFFGYVSSLV